GWQPTTRWLPTFDILLQPSEIDALPRSIMEAMACSITVLATRVGGIPECVNHGATGLLVVEEEVTASLEALVTNPEMRRVMGVEARSRCEALFDSRRMVHKFEELYLGLSPITVAEVADRQCRPDLIGGNVNSPVQRTFKGAINRN